MITLIPKKGRNRNQVRNWRPITLLNVDYKIYSKTIANRIKIVLPDLIHEDQTGFMSGRSITENIRKIVDLIEYSHTKQLPGLVVQIDYLKAFDRVDYNAVWQTFRYFGFEQEFIDMVKILFEDFNLCTTNNGYVSRSFKPSRGLFQGNPIAPYVFLLLIETLAIQLRNNKNIKGLNVNGVKFLLSQFADDMNLFIEFREEEWIQVMNVLDTFELNSGMKVNYEKTSIYRIGSLANTNAKFYSRRKVLWTNEPINVLGVWVSNSKKEMFDRNNIEIVQKIESVCHSWRYRELSLMGKACVLNSLVMSLVVYRFSVLPLLSKSIITQIEKVCKAFMYNNKKGGIPWYVTTGRKQNGGLGVHDGGKKDQALKAQWVTKIISLPKMKVLAYTNMQNPVRDLIWRCSIMEEDIRILFPEGFWRDVLQVWSKIHFDVPVTKGEVLNEILWLNSNIRINFKPVFYADMFAKNIVRIRDIVYPQGNFFTWGEMCSKYGNFPFTEYIGIVKSIPLNWKKMLQVPEPVSYDEAVPLENDILDKWLKLKLCVQIAYQSLNDDRSIVNKVMLKWNEGLFQNLTQDEFIGKIRRLYSLTNYPKLRAFQFKFLYFAVKTNVQLYHYKVKSSQMCEFCEVEKETVKHLFFYCIYTRKIWLHLQDKIGEEIEYSNVVYCETKTRKTYLFDFLILLAKYYIFCQKCKSECITVEGFVTYVKEIQNIEYGIAKKRGNVNRHIAKWVDY